MLIGTCARPEPAVVRKIEHPAGAVAARHRLAWGNDLIANEGNGIGGARDGEVAPAIPWDEAAAYLGQLSKAEAFEKALEWEIFAERTQVNLIIDRQNRAVEVDDIDRIVGAGNSISRHGFRRADRSRNQHGAVWQQRRNARECIGFAGEEERKGRLRPDQVGNTGNS